MPSIRSIQTVWIALCYPSLLAAPSLPPKFPPKKRPNFQKKSNSRHAKYTVYSDGLDSPLLPFLTRRAFPSPQVPAKICIERTQTFRKNVTPNVVNYTVYSDGLTALCYHFLLAAPSFHVVGL